jgi:hypothetical protein
MASDFNQPPAQNPFAAAPPSYPPPRSSKTWLWVLLAIAATSMVICCGCAGLMYFGMNKGMGVLGENLVKQLNNDPIAQEQLGEVQDAKFDFMATTKAAQESKGSAAGLLFHVEGSKASGDVIAEQEPGGASFRNARLKLPGQDEIKLGF